MTARGTRDASASKNIIFLHVWKAIDHYTMWMMSKGLRRKCEPKTGQCKLVFTTNNCAGLNETEATLCSQHYTMRQRLQKNIGEIVQTERLSINHVAWSSL